MTFFCFHWQNSFLSSSFDIKPTNLEFQMSCCGVEGYKDFEKARPFMDQVHICYYWQKTIFFIFQPDPKVTNIFSSIVALYALTPRLPEKALEWLYQNPAVSWNKTPTPCSSPHRLQDIEFNVSSLPYFSRNRIVCEILRSQTHSCTRYLVLHFKL